MIAAEWPRFIRRCPMCHGTFSSKIDSDVVALLSCPQCGATFKFSAVSRGYVYMMSSGSDPDRLELTEEEKKYNDSKFWQEVDQRLPYYTTRCSRCDVRMIHALTHFRVGNRSLLLGLFYGPDTADHMTEDVLPLSLYVCPKCREVKLALPLT